MNKLVEKWATGNTKLEYYICNPTGEIEDMSLEEITANLIGFRDLERYNFSAYRHMTLEIIGKIKSLGESFRLEVVKLLQTLNEFVPEILLTDFTCEDNINLALVENPKIYEYYNNLTEAQYELVLSNWHKTHMYLPEDLQRKLPRKDFINAIATDAILGHKIIKERKIYETITNEELENIVKNNPRHIMKIAIPKDLIGFEKCYPFLLKLECLDIDTFMQLCITTGHFNIKDKDTLVNIINNCELNSLKVVSSFDGMFKTDLLEQYYVYKYIKDKQALTKLSFIKHLAENDLLELLKRHNMKLVGHINTSDIIRMTEEKSEVLEYLDIENISIENDVVFTEDAEISKEVLTIFRDYINSIMLNNNIDTKLINSENSYILSILINKKYISWDSLFKLAIKPEHFKKYIIPVI